MVKVPTPEIVARFVVEIAAPLLSVKVVIVEIVARFAAVIVPEFVKVVMPVIVVRFAAVIVPALVTVTKLERVVFEITKVPLLVKVIHVALLAKVVAAVKEVLAGITYLA